MSNIPSDLKYTKTHEWIRVEDDDCITVGITDTAQKLLGDLVFVELPESGSTLAPGDECAVVESVKAASDIYAPVSGEVTEINAALSSRPELINEDPYGDGWIFRMRCDDISEIDELLDADDYEEHAAAEDH